MNPLLESEGMAGVRGMAMSSINGDKE